MRTEVKYKGVKYILAEEAKSQWIVSTPGSVSLSPAQVSDPEDILERTPGAPKMADLAKTIWRRNPGDYSPAKNPWKGVKSGVAELETVLEHTGTGKRWKILLRGLQKRYIVVHCYQVP